LQIKKKNNGTRTHDAQRSSHLSALDHNYYLRFFLSNYIFTFVFSILKIQICYVLAAKQLMQAVYFHRHDVCISTHD